MDRRAFTLVELLVVIAIVGMLSTVAVIATSGARDKARIAAGQSFEATVQRAAGSDLIGEWLFNEGSGTTAADTSGNGHNGAITGATWTAGQFGNALNFVPTAYVALGNDPSLTPTNFTITAWIKPGDFSGSYNYIYSNARDCCGTYNGINFSLYGNILAGNIWNGGSQYISSVGRISNSAGWTFVGFSYDGAKMALYINGHLDSALNTALGVGKPATYNTYIGGMGFSPGLGFNGSIDQVRLYGAAIVADDMRKIYLAEKAKYVAER